MPKKNRQATRTTPGFTGPFKGAPQQGTLFDVRTLPKTGEEIGPRGYSLNRSRQFNEIIQRRPGYGMRAGQVGFGVKHEAIDEDAIERQTRPAVRPQMHPFGPSHETEPETEEGFDKTPLHQVLGRARSKLIDTLARSTIAPESLKGLSDITLFPPDETRAGSYHSRKSGSAITAIRLHQTGSSMESLGGSYREPAPWSPEEDAPPRTKQPQQRGPVDPESEITLLHEVGHHVSEQAGTPHSEYKTPQQQGSEEAYADRFAIERYREDPRNIHWRGQTDPREHTYLARGSEGKWGVLGKRNYKAQLGRENLPAPRVGSDTFQKAMEEEQRLRPTLDVGHEEPVFTDVPRRWRETPEEHVARSKRTTVEQARKEQLEKRTQKTAGQVGTWRQQRAEMKRRWGVRRGTLGRQWEQRDEPS